MIEELRVKNWRSHQKTSVELDAEVNAIVGDMGSGKSSLLEAVTFALYGTTPALKSNDVRLDEVLRRNPEPVDEAAVAVELSIEGDRYRVERVIERSEGTTESKLKDLDTGETLEGPKTQDVTAEVEKLLGMDFKGFTRAVYSEQNNLDLFLNMRPGERKARLDELLELDRFEAGRKTVVKLKNRLKNRHERRMEQLEDIEDELDREELESLREQISKKKERKEELEEHRKKLGEKLEELEDRESELKQERETRRELEEKKTELETRKKSFTERIEEMNYLDVEDPDKQLERHREDLEELEAARERLEDTRKHIEMKEDRIDELEEDLEELEDQAEKFEQFDEVKEALQEREEQLKQRNDELSSVETRLEDLEERVEALENASGDCPVCGRELDADHREQLLEERRSRRQELEQRRKKLRESIEELEKELKEFKEKRDKLLKYEDSPEKLARKKEEKDELREELEELQETREELEDPERAEKMGELEEEIELLENTRKKLELEDSREELEEELEELEEEIEENEFAEEELEELQESLSETRQQLSRLEEKKSSVDQLLKEKAKRLNSLEKQFEKKSRYEDELEKLDQLLDFTHDYEKALEKTQLQLRERFVKKLNELMDELWTRVYPYDYYYSLRLNPSRDYALELLDAEDNWISAEGEVSGGERHSAALVLRLGLTFILSPRIGVLMLDEPTHNMDSTGVSELAETLRSRTSELIDQLIIVTHDRDLEAASTGKLYECRKSDGVTSVEEIS